MSPGRIAGATGPGVLAWPAMPASCRAAPGAARRSGPAPARAAGGGAPAASGLWLAPGAASGGGAVPGQGGLGAAQARQLQAMARAARTWRAGLPALTAAARQQGDAALQIELAKLDALLQQVASAQSLTLAAYLAAVSASHQALALWAANAGSLDPAQQEAWQKADTGAAELTTAANTGSVGTPDLSGRAPPPAPADPPPAHPAAAPDPAPLARCPPTTSYVTP